MRFVLTDAAHPRIVLKHGSHFLVFDQSASIPACNTLGYGYYRNDTRHISQWELLLDDMPLSLLSSTADEGYSGSFLYTNPQTENLMQQKITVLRDVVLADLLWERITLKNFHNEPTEFELKLKFQSDFADMFEVRGLNRATRGERMMPFVSNDSQCLFLAYRGLDGVLLETVIEFVGIRPDSIQDGEVLFRMQLPVRKPCRFEFSVTSRWGGNAAHHAAEENNFQSAKSIAEKRCNAWYGQVAKVETTNELFDVFIKRSLRDVYILRQGTPKGFGLAAGIPWYCALFGRDSAITSSQLLPFAPELARECLEVLAAYQGQNEVDFKAEMPGRILHELRLGELARSNQVPHSPYYGTVDATQLWLLLFCQYINWTGDLDFARNLWPAVKQAVSWLDHSTNNGSGYITYQRVSEHGLENQGWKDSGDAVMHTNGHLAAPPIAICEAQGYLYAARMELAQIARMLGHRSMARTLERQAVELKTMFERDFWMEDKQFIALALDRDGRQVGVVSSNPGHCLASGIVNGDKAQAIADRLMSKELHTGWGIRTLTSSAVAFNPISYHNGSVWPHDNAMIAEGMRRIGRIADVHRIMAGLFDVAQSQPDFRLPELFCGFDKEESSGLINYPVSCSPQAWSAGSIFQLLKASINFQPDAHNRRIRIVDPSLPGWLETLKIRGLKIGAAEIDLNLVASHGSTSCQILRKSGDVRVIIEG
jgi:glycogen debranching enzyme